ncbi:hypothetical protein ACFL6S_15045 [Candidatus Poribacteria bacterium]
MAKKGRKSGSRRLQDQQYRQIISRSRPEVEKLLQQLGLLLPTSLEKLPHAHRMSAQIALTERGEDPGSHFSVSDFSQMKEKEKIVAYYARPEVQQEIYRYAQGRMLTVLRSFKPMFSSLYAADDVLPLMFHYLKGNRWPSMHGTILRRNQEGKKVCDFVFEPDFKKSWSVAFGAARPIVRLFLSVGLPFFVKFSGNTSPHIIVPGEALTTADKRDMKEHEFREAVYAFVMRHMGRPGLLDGPNWKPEHFLRLAYSIHELGGKVSMPIEPEEFDSFNPEKARIENAVVMGNWWCIPEDAAERGREFVERVLQNYPRLVTGIGKPKSEHKWKAPAVPRKLRQIFGAGWYAKALAGGQQLLPSAAGDLSARVGEKTLSGEMVRAMDMLGRWKSSGMKIDLKAAADVFQVDVVELQHQWRSRSGDDEHSMDLMGVHVDPAYHYEYYSRNEIQEAFYHYAAGRCFPVQGAKGHFRLQEPSDIPPLAAFFASSNAKWRGFECTRGIYDPLEDQLVACDIGMVIDFSRSDYVSAVELAQALMTVLQKYDVFCFAKFDGNEALEIVIPAETMPKQVDGQPTALQMVQIASGLSRGFRRMPEVSGNDCLLMIQPYGYTRPVYSINQETGLACAVLMLEDLQDFSPECAEPINVSVNKSWLDIPAHAALQAQRFMKYALSPNWHPASD